MSKVAGHATSSGGKMGKITPKKEIFATCKKRGGKKKRSVEDFSPPRGGGGGGRKND